MDNNIDLEMDLSVGLEKFFMKDKDMERQIIELPRIRRHELAKVCKPGDIMLAYPGKFKATINKLFYQITSKGQGMSFSSLKLVGCNNDVIGYGLKGDARLAKMSLNTLPTRYKGILVIRHKSMTPTKAKEIYEWCLDKFKKDIPYDFIGLAKSTLKRLLHISKKQVTVDQIDRSIRKLYCSIIVHLAYKRAGIPTGVSKVGDFDIFPKDFFYSDQFKKIGAYFARGEISPSSESIQLSWDIKRDVLTEIMDNITLTNHITDKKDFAEHLLRVYLDRTEMHIELVKECGRLLIPALSKYGIDINLYKKELDGHDSDKLDSANLATNAVVTQHQYNPNINKYFTISQNILDAYNNDRWTSHYKKNIHHVGEHYGKLVDRTWVVEGDNHHLGIATMFADWMAMGIENGTDNGDWWEKCKKEKKYSFQPNDVKMIEDLLEFEKTIDPNKLPKPKEQLSVYGAWVPSVKLSKDGLPIVTTHVSDDTHLGVCFFYDIPNTETLTSDKFHHTILGQAVRHSDNPTCWIKESIARAMGRNSREYILASLHDYDPPKELTIDYNATVAKYPHIKEFIPNMLQCDETDNNKSLNVSIEEYTTIKDIINENATFNIGTEDLKPSLEVKNHNIPAKKKAILDYICKHCDIMDPSKLNSERYKKLIGGMTDKQFDKFMVDMRDGRFQLHLVAPNMKVNLKVPNMLKCADSLKLKLFHKVWMKDNATGRKFLSDNEYLVVQLPVRRQEQFIDKKMSVPDNDRTIDGLTGQVSWESKSSSITNPEIQILASRNMEATLFEFINVRGGNINSYAEFKRSLEENGEARLNDLDPNSRTRTAVMGGVLLTAMLLEHNL